VPNHRSHRVMERLGMQRHETGTFEMNGERFEAHVYVLTLEQWRLAEFSET
jgi:RimJ/RimL family protein N-acetyltransferase